MTDPSLAQNRGVSRGHPRIFSTPGSRTLEMLPMSRRIRERVPVPFVFIAAYLLLAAGMVFGLVYFVAELFRRPGMTARAPVPAIAEGGT